MLELKNEKEIGSSISKPTFSLVCPLRVKMLQAWVDGPLGLLFLRSQSFNVLSVDAETSVSESKNFA